MLPKFRYKEIEFKLLVAIFITLTIGFLAVCINKGIGLWPNFGWLALFFIEVLLLHQFIRWQLKNAEILLLPISVLLVGISLVFLLRLEPDLPPKFANLFQKQCLYAVMCYALLFPLIWALKKNWLNLLFTYLQHYYLPLVILIGIWVVVAWRCIAHLDLKPVMAVEVLKVLVIFFIADYLARHYPSEKIDYKPLKRFLLICGIFLFLASDLGPIFLIAGLFLVLLYVARSDERGIWKLILRVLHVARSNWKLILLLVGIISLCFLLKFPSKLHTRFMIWFSPELYSGQLMQAQWAISAGGLFGTGLGLSYAHKIPEVPTDFIFALLCEEIGLVGITLILCLYILMVYFGFRAAKNVQETFPKFLIVGLVSIFALQTIVITGGIIGLLPLTGITLPFLSYGLSSLLVNILLVGGLLFLSAKRSLEKVQDSPESEKTNRNLIKILWVLVGCLCIVWARCAYMQFFKQEMYYTREYKDQESLENLRQLVKKGVIYAEDGQVKISEDKILGDRIKGWIDNGYICADKGEIKGIDQYLVKEINPRIKAMERLTARGDFYDRQGRLLVETVKTKGINERRYKYNEIFFHPVGYWNKYGWKGGLEKELERYLINSERVVENPVRFEKKNPDIKKSKITLTIDKDIQMAAYEALGKYKGVVIIIAPESGEVLALVSKPAFNPNAKGIKNWNRAYHNEEESPFLNRALYRGYPPGSTFKVVVAAAAIESGAVELDDVFECRGEWKKFAIHDFGWHKKKGWPGHNLEGKARFNIKEALAHSCNVAYARIGLKLGKERLFEYARKFGFYKKFDLLNIKGTEFSSIKSVLYPEMSDPARIPPEKFTESHLAQTALGQYNVRTTPLQMALIAATIANKGILTDPHIVKKIELDGGKCLYSSKDKAEKHRVVREATASTLTDMMVAVMKRGTGKNAPKIYENGKRIWVAGKTGTAQINPGETSHSWFIGFAPADGMPKYAISVVAENSGSGASVATPIAINILKTLKVSGHSK